MVTTTVIVGATAVPGVVVGAIVVVVREGFTAVVADSNADVDAVPGVPAPQPASINPKTAAPAATRAFNCSPSSRRETQCTIRAEQTVTIRSRSAVD